MAGAERIEGTLTAIRAHGGRVTDQRRAILTVLFEEADHVTADDLQARVRARLPEVHVTTVYRFLDTLQELGLVAHVHLGHGPAAFHLVDPATGPTAHVVCGACGRVVTVQADLLAAWSAGLEARHGFRLEHQHFALAGTCAGCRAE